MADKLTSDDWKAIIKSLEYSRLRFENYEYPSDEIKRDRINGVNDLIKKIKSLNKKSK